MTTFYGLCKAKHPGTWSVLEAAERWRDIRRQLIALEDRLPEDSADRVESLCFMVDELLSDGSKVGSLEDYSVALEEVANVLLESQPTLVQTLIVGELQKLALPQ